MTVLPSAPALRAPMLEAFSDERLHLILLATEACNFRCVYCYEDFAHGRMRPSTVEGVWRLLERRAPRLRDLEISWFGGEPLIAPDIVLGLSRVARDLSRTHAFEYRATATTNGSRLDPEMLAALVDSGVTGFQISLDGPGETHDRTRRRADGAGTWTGIWENLRAARETALQFTIMLRLHVSPGSQAALEDWLPTLRSELLGDDRFRVSFKAIRRLGGPNDAKLDVFGYSEAATAERRLEAMLHAPGPALADEPVDTYVCYAARPNSLLVRADGRLGKCTVALRAPGNDIGHLLPDGTVRIDDERLRPWLEGWRTRDEQTLSCPWSVMRRRTADA